MLDLSIFCNPNQQVFEMIIGGFDNRWKVPTVREAFQESINGVFARLRLAGYTQGHVAEKMGILHQNISRWKRGQIPHAKTLDRFVKVTNRLLPKDERIGPNDLFSGFYRVKRS